MERKRLYRVLTLAAVALVLGSLPVAAGHLDVQCPCDCNGDAVCDSTNAGECTIDIGGTLYTEAEAQALNPQWTCMHLTSGDGYVVMADGRDMYMFGFGDATGHPVDDVMVDYIWGAEYSGPTIVVDEGDEFYLSLSNVGMLGRPDLFDPHTVHWHGFPQASTVFDGLPESGLAINMGATLTYYYNVIEPGTYMYHCHVEATEHMQMGMLANLYVRPAQNRLPGGTDLDGWMHSNPDWGLCSDDSACGSDGDCTLGVCEPNPGGDDPLVGDTYAYNDGDGSTYYDVEVPIQLSSFDSHFHDASESTQPLPFALMRDDYPMINGRGYPDTVAGETAVAGAPPLAGSLGGYGPPGLDTTQPVSSLITAEQGEKILLRISNIAVTRYYTLASLNLPMKVVGRDARLLRGPTGLDLYYDTNSVTLGGGETADAIIDTTGVAPGTYFLYTTNLNFLTNGEGETYGAAPVDGMSGMMTEIRVTAPTPKAANGRELVAMNEGPGVGLGTE